MMGWKQDGRLVRRLVVAGWGAVLVGVLMTGLPVAGNVAAADGEAASAGFAVVNDAWAEGDHPRVRALLAELLDNRELAPHVRSYAHLRLAQSYRVTGDTAGSRREYKAIAGRDEYPWIHRYEAGEWLREFDRLDQGLPARDPTAPRTPIALIDSFAAEVFVAPDGDDAQDGCRKRPFRTLTRARDAIRALRAEGASGPFGVRVLPGTYPIQQTLTLTAEDSGQEGEPVVYRAEEPGRAVLYGGRRIGGFEPVRDPEILARLPEEARGKVWQTDLAAQGVHDWGELRVRGGIGQAEPPPTLELYYNGQPMTLARWPNEGFVEIRELLQPGRGPRERPRSSATWTIATPVGPGPRMPGSTATGISCGPMPRCRSARSTPRPKRLPPPSPTTTAAAA
jgi:hypothetical protein